MTTRLPWWRTDEYKIDESVPLEFAPLAGPNGVALVRAWNNGSTDEGWGLAGKNGKPGFMENYTRGRFAASRVLPGYDVGRWNFAFIMRSMKLVCIDIDGKNGGVQGALNLGMLPYTLAETSRSGDGYHLFYTIDDDEWSEDYGFAPFTDRIGIQPGVDLRVVGCVYHYPSQRWNERKPVELPQHIKDMLLKKQQTAAAQIAVITKTLESGDPTEVLLMQDALVSDLKKPIPAGRRNTTLYAIGSQMFLAGTPDWENLVFDRAISVGLDKDEAHKLVANIQKYEVTKP